MSENLLELESRSRKALANLSIHHKLFFITLAKLVGGLKIFKDKEDFKEFLAIIASFGGAAESGLADVELSLLNSRVANILTSKYCETFLNFFNHIFFLALDDNSYRVHGKLTSLCNKCKPDEFLAKGHEMLPQYARKFIGVKTSAEDRDKIANELVRLGYPADVQATPKEQVDQLANLLPTSFNSRSEKNESPLIRCWQHHVAYVSNICTRVATHGKKCFVPRVRKYFQICVIIGGKFKPIYKPAWALTLKNLLKSKTVSHRGKIVKPVLLNKDGTHSDFKNSLLAR